MKKIKSLLIFGAVLLLGFAGFGQQGITYRFNNMKIAPAAGPDTLIFDVEAKGSTTATYTTAFTIKVFFNTAVFGSNAIPVVVEKLALTQPTGYNLVTMAISAASNKFQSAFQANKASAPHTGSYQIAYLSNLTTSYQGVVRYKMLINGTGDCGIQLHISGGGSMAVGNNYVLNNGATTTINYNPVAAENNLLTLPSVPNINLLISEVADPSNSSTNFVEIYNAGSTAVDFTNHYAWYLNVNGSTGIKLSGTLAAGGKYTVASDAVDFTGNLTNIAVGTDGTSNYLLTTYGNYSNGTTIDVYNGSATGFDFTGKHAVRLYNVTSPNPTLTTAEWAITPAQNIDMTPGSHASTINWDGTTGEWRNKPNWTGSFIPDAGHNVNIPNSGETTPIISFGDNATCYDLAIGGSGIGLIIESDEFAGDGSLITYGATSGTASVKRFLKADRYWYVTQPVTSATANVFLHTWLFTYDEPSSDWTPFIEPETTPLDLMQGYAVWTSSVNPWHQGWDPVGDTTTSFDGVLNSGAISTSLTASGDGWNFVGNPYASAINWEAAGWTKIGLVTNSYSVWDGATYGAYTVGSGGTNGATKYIPAGQGFFVQANSSGSLGVTNAVREHNAIDFWKSEENMLNRLSLTISNGALDDETVIYFNESATTEVDYSFDARKLLAPAAPQTYTMIGTVKMAVNTFNNFIETNKVIMGVNIPETGDYTISAGNIESFNGGTHIYLEDLLTGQSINLRQVNTYTFSAEEGTSERFAVHFTEFQGIGDGISEEVDNIFSVDQSVYVNYNASRGEIVIYNILGQEMSHSVAANGMNIISVPQGNSVYIVKVISDNTTVTKKVFVK